MLRNKEIRQFAAAFAGVSAVFVLLGFQISGAAGVLMLAASASLAAVALGFTWARYRNLARLSEQIDLVLHNADRLLIGAVEEGELSILQSEITKMTLRIREQNDALRREKQYLADSLADIAHQLRTPLTSLNLLLTLLPDASEDRAELVREGEALLRRMDWLLTALLRLSRLDAGMIVFQNEPLAAEDLLQTTLQPLLIPMELHGISVRTEVPEGVVLYGDRNWLAEALQNILKNCMESAGEGGSITVTCSDTPLYMEWTIRDSGPGFLPEDLPHLFDRFYRGRTSAASGYGIGLALCKTILTRQGGTVTAKNHPQGGAVFRIRFPKQREDGGAAA